MTCPYCLEETDGGVTDRQCQHCKRTFAADGRPTSADMAQASNRHERRRAAKWERENRQGKGRKK